MKTGSDKFMVPQKTLNQNQYAVLTGLPLQSYASEFVGWCQRVGSCVRYMGDLISKKFFLYSVSNKEIYNVF